MKNRKQKNKEKAILMVTIFMLTFDIVFVLGLMSYGMMVFKLNNGGSLFTSTIFASILSSLMGYLMLNSLVSPLFEKLNKTEEKNE